MMVTRLLMVTPLVTVDALAAIVTNCRCSYNHPAVSYKVDTVSPLNTVTSLSCIYLPTFRSRIEGEGPEV